MTWYAHTPIAWVRACLEMLPRIRAHESLVESERIAVGTGAIKPAERSRVRARWEREAQGQTTGGAGLPGGIGIVSRR